MRIGCRAHDLGRFPSAEELAAAVVDAGFESAQLALAKALDPRPAAGGLSPEYARGVARAFSSRGAAIAVLGCYINPIHPDPAERAAGLARFKEHLRLAKDFSTGSGGYLDFPVVATETGSFNADCSPHPDNGGDRAFGLLVEALAEIAEAAEACGTVACVEGVVRHVARTPARLRKAIDAVGSPSLMVLFDPVNYIDEANCAEQGRVLDEAFDLLADRMLVVHLKDFRLSRGRVEVCPPGTGLLDLPRILRFLRERRPGVDALIEDLRPSEMGEAISRVRRLYEIS
jgi:sugar phosphate isomerase/epimerase